ncbi:cystathionine gamma-synthase [Xylariaceae sp. AK1471]|nr:cystathionine gamma-synthase [Xylariaceae sp. AK1471]
MSTSSLSAVDPSTVEFGQSLPPHGPHTITMHVPKWETGVRFRDGDMSLLMQLKSIYPRFSPFGLSATLCKSIAEKVSLPEGYGCAAFLSPDVWASNQTHAVSAFRKKDRLDASELRHHVVELGGVRLYVIGFPRAKAQAAIFQWQHGGLGFSTRVAEALLPHTDSLVHVGEFPEGVGAPEPTFFAEGSSHAALRERIAGLVMRACASEHEKSVTAEDVFLYQTGMASITRLHEAIVSLRAGPTVVFGAVFHSTYHMFEESEGGLKHYGYANDADVNDFERYLEGGGECAYVFTEFPSNPIMVSVDLMRLRSLADKYGFFLVVDDTCASFANIDLLAAADAVVTSLTKAFSGYADVMAGSVVLNPNSASAYPALKQAVSSRFHNELFEADAAHLLSNSEDYLARCMIHNRNANALAFYFRFLAQDSISPVTRVWYPPYSPGSDHLKAFMRKPTADFLALGAGCLLSVEFETVEQAAAFYDALNFFQGPHLGAHLTLAIPYNTIVYGKDHPEVHAAYGLKQQQVRIAVGLEDQNVLLRRCAEALSKMETAAA